MSDAGGIISAAVLPHALAEGFGGFHAHRFIEHHERLQRGVALGSADAGRFAVRNIKGAQERIRRAAAAEDIDAAAILLRTFLDLPREGRVAGGFLEEMRRRGWHDGASADFRIEQAAHGELNVAHHFTLDSETRSASKQAVVGVAIEQLWRDLAGLLVGFTRHDKSQQLLRAPVVLHELDGQPVEQFWMTRRRALRAQVFGSLDQTGAKDSLPHAIHIRTGRGGRISVNEPFGEGES